MENISKLTSLNIYYLLKNYITSIKSQQNKNNELSEINEEILRPVYDVYSSATNESFVIFKIEESPTKIYYFKYIRNFNCP